MSFYEIQHPAQPQMTDLRSGPARMQGGTAYSSYSTLFRASSMLTSRNRR